MRQHSKLGESLFKPKACIQIGMFVNLVLTVFKFMAGIFGLSQAMIADALHSLSDILTSVVAYAGICIGERPADKDHPYGHGNAETIAAVLVGLIIMSIGVYAGISAALAIVHRQFAEPLNIALFAAIISIVTKEGLFHYTVKVGKISNSPAVVADAWHHRSDAISSVAALIGIVGAKISFLYLDPLAGIVVSLLIVRIALKVMRANIGIIMDEQPQIEFINNVKAQVKQIAGVQTIDSIRVHRRGPRFTVDLEIAVDGNISVAAGHKIATEVKTKLVKRINNIADVMVHVNPASA